MHQSVLGWVQWAQDYELTLLQSLYCLHTILRSVALFIYDNITACVVFCLHVSDKR